MQPISWTQHFAGTPIIVDKFAYTEKRTWRAVAVVVDKRRPNSKKPIYKKKLFITRTPRAYLVKGVGLIVHPDIYNGLREKMAQSVNKSLDDMTRAMFGLSNQIEQTTLTTEAFVDAWKKVGIE